MNELYNNYFKEIKDIIWKVAIYVRLSREDEKDSNYRKQSESIENQIKFLKQVVKTNNWILVNVYKDDGYTGTNFKRPGFIKMINDIDKGLINLVITKDLSRLGRDYIETGEYVEKIFPKKNIRYIAVNDNVDTFDSNNTNNDITPFKSVMNDMYAKDISNKVRTALQTKAFQGECIKAFLPYGYKKDINNKNKIIIDEKVSDNIKLIFDLYISGKSKSQIAQILNEKQIITPLKYKKENTNYSNPNANISYIWNATVINKILRDRIYVGDLVQLKYTKINYKVQKVVKRPIDQYAIVSNNHPAIIDRKVFNAVQEMLDKKTNEFNYSNRKKHLLTGLVFCKCGSRVSYNLNHGKTFRCVCSSYKKYGTKFCHNIHLKEDELIEEVSKSLKNNIAKYLNMDKLDYVHITKDNVNFNKNKINELNRKKEKLYKLISNLYEDKILGIISEDTFAMLIQKYEKEKKQYEEKIKQINKEKNVTSEEILNEKRKIEEYMKELIKFDTINYDNKSLVFKLIDKIIIDDKTININYNFKIK